MGEPPGPSHRGLVLVGVVPVRLDVGRFVELVAGMSQARHIPLEGNYETSAQYEDEGVGWDYRVSLRQGYPGNGVHMLTSRQSSSLVGSSGGSHRNLLKFRTLFSGFHGSDNSLGDLMAMRTPGEEQGRGMSARGRW